MLNKLVLILNFIKALPKIVFRLTWITIKKKEFLFSEFRPTNIICVDGTLNQLVWDLENPIFLSISNSSKIYFNSEEFVFKVSKLETEFVLKAYTLKGVKKYQNSIKVLCLNQKSFDDLLLSENMTKLSRKTIRLKENELVAKKLSKVRNTRLSAIDVSVRPKANMVNGFESDKLNLVLDLISKSNNKKELTQLKQEI
jgi:hypothetical protein